MYEMWFEVSAFKAFLNGSRFWRWVSDPALLPYSDLHPDQSLRTESKELTGRL